MSWRWWRTGSAFSAPIRRPWRGNASIAGCSTAWPTWTAGRSRFDRRLRETDWREAAVGDAAFALSPADLVRHAPVIDEFKQLDRGIVATSVGHKWRQVRTAFRDRAIPERIAADWRAGSGA